MPDNTPLVINQAIPGDITRSTPVTVLKYGFSKNHGLIPEPILEELGHQYGNKYFVLQQAENQTLIRDLLEVVDEKEPRDLLKALKSERPSKDCWTWQRMDRLVRKHLPRKRILHPYPRERFHARLKARAV